MTMKPAPFAYADPESVDEALELLDSELDGAVLLAGGQSLVPLLNMRLARPRLVIDLRRISELSTYHVHEGELHVGAMVRVCHLLEDPAAEAIPGLLDAIRLVGHSQIRARTTVGGSISHADPAAELPALLAALEGEVVLRSHGRGERTVPAAEFFVGAYSTCRQPDELVTTVRMPAPRLAVRVNEVAKRPGDFALVGAVVGLADDGDAVSDARICLFGVADRPLRMTAAERLLTGVGADRTAFATAAQSVREALEPSSDIHASAEYRRHVAATLVERSLMAVA